MKCKTCFTKLHLMSGVSKENRSSEGKLKDKECNMKACPNPDCTQYNKWFNKCTDKSHGWYYAEEQKEYKGKKYCPLCFEKLIKII